MAVKGSYKLRLREFSAGSGDDAKLSSSARSSSRKPTCEDKECSAVRNETALVVGQAIGNGTHAMLPDAKAEVALSIGALLEVPKCLHQCHVAGRQIC